MRRTLDPGLAHRLHAARLRSGMSVRELGRRAGISHSMAAYVCTGRRVPSKAVAVRLARALDLDEDLVERLWQAAVERAWR